MNFEEIKQELQLRAKEYAEAYARRYSDMPLEIKEAVKRTHYAYLVNELLRVLKEA